MRADNVICITGRTSADPDMKYITADRVVASFNVAVNRAKDSSGNEVTDWFKCEFWGKQAEIAGEYVKKGTLISVVGACHIEKWEKEGVKRSTVKIKGDSFKLLSSKNDNTNESPTTNKYEKSNSKIDDFEDDDIPPF